MCTVLLSNVVFVCSAHREVLRMHYDDYSRCFSELNVFRVKALLETPRENKPVMAMANVPLSMPEVNIEVCSKHVEPC